MRVAALAFPFPYLNPSRVEIQLGAAMVTVLSGTIARLLVASSRQRRRAFAALGAAREALDFARRAAGLGTWDWDLATGRASR